MSVAYKFLDKNKNVVFDKPSSTCFSSTNDEYKKYPEAIYLSYKVNPTVTLKQVEEYVNFLNNIKWFYKINIKEFLKTKTYTFVIANQNSFKTFATLTVLRYLEEENKAVEFILKNINNTKISKLNLLLLSCIYTRNENHFLNRAPQDVASFIKFKLSKRQFLKDKKVTELGLHKYFSTVQSTWRIDTKVQTALLDHYGLIPL